MAPVTYCTMQSIIMLPWCCFLCFCTPLCLSGGTDLSAWRGNVACMLLLAGHCFVNPASIWFVCVSCFYELRLRNFSFKRHKTIVWISARIPDSETHWDPLGPIRTSQPRFRLKFKSDIWVQFVVVSSFSTVLFYIYVLRAMPFTVICTVCACN